jgi:hypothetical protein
MRSREMSNNLQMLQDRMAVNFLEFFRPGADKLAIIVVLPSASRTSFVKDWLGAVACFLCRPGRIRLT